MLSVFMYHKIVYGMDMIFSILLNSTIHRFVYKYFEGVCVSTNQNIQRSSKLRSEIVWHRFFAVPAFVRLLGPTSL